MMNRVLANATVDVIRPSTPKRLGIFKVTVWGKPPADWVKTYEIQAKSDNIAAREGIDRFVREVQAMVNTSEG
jgi:hypothetical protein